MVKQLAQRPRRARAPGLLAVDGVHRRVRKQPHGKAVVHPRRQLVLKVGRQVVQHGDVDGDTRKSQQRDQVGCEPHRAQQYQSRPLLPMIMEKKKSFTYFFFFLLTTIPIGLHNVLGHERVVHAAVLVRVQRRERIGRDVLESDHYLSIVPRIKRAPIILQCRPLRTQNCLFYFQKKIRNFYLCSCNLEMDARRADVMSPGWGS